MITHSHRDLSHIIQRMAQISSDVFSPLLIPTYGMAAMLWLTPLQFLPEPLRVNITIVIAAMTALFPTAVIFGLISLGKVKDFSLHKRKERFVPAAAIIVGLTGAILYLRHAHAPIWMWLFFISGIATTLIGFIITFRWKISGHTTAMAQLLALIYWLGYQHLLPVAPLLLVSIFTLLTGWVCTARLLLHRHTLGQVFAGVLLGLTVTLLTLFLSTPAI
ncbi:MAG: phosphatase PAP2 family protein [Muribaculaceae bacterium]|nr:phosphatase PAP2 family protein [Muribaculaceae bacterium]